MIPVAHCFRSRQRDQLAAGLGGVQRWHRLACKEWLLKRYANVDSMAAAAPHLAAFEDPSMTAVPRFA